MTVRTAITTFLRNNANTIEHMENTMTHKSKQLLTPKSFRTHINNLKYTEPCAVRFWKNKLDIDITEQVWNIPILSTKESRLRELQWKILHNIYPTNILLLKMELANNNRCALCDMEID